jgi:hypothetical protein
VAAGGNQTSRASTCRAVQAPLADPTQNRDWRPESDFPDTGATENTGGSGGATSDQRSLSEFL